MSTEEIVKLLVRRHVRLYRSLVTKIVQSRSLGWKKASKVIAAAILAAQSDLPHSVILGLAAGVMFAVKQRFDPAGILPYPWGRS